MIWREDKHITECFATEAQLDARIAELRAQRDSDGAASDFKHHRGVIATGGSQCSGYLRLYSGTGHSGTVLYLQGRFQWHNLADFGFDQQTSSYRIGPCSSYFADYAAGGGDWYPTSLTGAYDQAASMQSGWNNDVSSVYIN